MFLLSLSALVVLFGSCQASWKVTCDFDLEPIAEIIEYLPDECKEIYKSGSESTLYKASLVESMKFKEFYEQLDEYERKESSTPPGEVPKENTELRFKIYNATMLSNCSNITNSLPDADKTKDYYNCLATKREEMIHLIPK